MGFIHIHQHMALYKLGRIHRQSSGEVNLYVLFNVLCQRRILINISRSSAGCRIIISSLRRYMPSTTNFRPLEIRPQGIQASFIVFLRQGVTVQPCLAWNSLCRTTWPEMERSACLWLWSAETKFMHHHTRPLTYFLKNVQYWACFRQENILSTL